MSEFVCVQVDVVDGDCVDRRIVDRRRRKVDDLMRKLERRNDADAVAFYLELSAERKNDSGSEVKKLVEHNKTSLELL